MIGNDEFMQWSIYFSLQQQRHVAIEPIKIEGLKEFRKGLKEVQKELTRGLRLVFNEAVQLIVDEVRPKVPHDSGDAAASVRAQSSQTKAKIVAGGRKAPYYPWLDFGGRVGKTNKIKRAFIKDGRYIYATYFLLKADGTFEEMMSTKLGELANSAGIDIEIDVS